MQWAPLLLVLLSLCFIIWILAKLRGVREELRSVREDVSALAKSQREALVEVDGALEPVYELLDRQAAGLSSPRRPEASGAVRTKDDVPREIPRASEAGSEEATALPNNIASFLFASAGLPLDFARMAHEEGAAARRPSPQEERIVELDEAPAAAPGDATEDRGGGAPNMEPTTGETRE